MKNVTTLLALALSACFSLPAAAQEVAGNWLAESVSGVEPVEGAALKLTFGEEGKATVTYTLAGESQSWQYKFALGDGQLTLEPAKPIGEPQTITYDIKFDEGKLLLLSPRPKPAEEDAEPSDQAEAAEGESGEAAEETQAPEAEEEDTRVPVWVLVKA